ncbi:MAG: hypothetical protein QHH10_07500 [Peptococcaceae bacterium]|jgi:hypothetical protein|nr:hypothetical protein [Peptococcaceae bacterium]MDH7525144.1 hypothetical protein [Peptococcaceae bacterium]
MNCPVCSGKAVGRVGIDRYYCWNCFLEYQLYGSEVRIYSVSEDGSLVDYEQAGITGIS